MQMFLPFVMFVKCTKDKKIRGMQYGIVVVSTVVRGSQHIRPLKMAAAAEKDPGVNKDLAENPPFVQF